MLGWFCPAEAAEHGSALLFRKEEERRLDRLLPVTRRGHVEVLRFGPGEPERRCVGVLLHARRTAAQQQPGEVLAEHIALRTGALVQLQRTRRIAWQAYALFQQRAQIDLCVGIATSARRWICATRGCTVSPCAATASGRRDDEPG